MIAALWWACFGLLAFFGVGELTIVAVVWPATGRMPTPENFSLLVCLPLSLVALRKARRARHEGL